MKKFFRMPRNFRASIAIALLFCILFPYSLIAETAYKAPQNSLSYFLENDNEQNANSSEMAAANKSTVTVAEPTVLEPEIVVPELAVPEITAPEVQARNNEERHAAIEAIRSRLLATKTTTDQPTSPVQVPIPVSNTSVTVVPAAQFVEAPVIVTVETPVIEAPVIAANENVTETAITLPEKAATEIVSATSNDSPFASAMAKMQQTKAKRMADAEKLGLVLPSQGGDIATVSPSLSRMHMAIKAIMTR